VAVQAVAFVLEGVKDFGHLAFMRLVAGQAALVPYVLMVVRRREHSNDAVTGAAVASPFDVMRDLRPWLIRIPLRLGGDRWSRRRVDGLSEGFATGHD